MKPLNAFEEIRICCNFGKISQSKWVSESPQRNLEFWNPICSLIFANSLISCNFKIDWDWREALTDADSEVDGTREFGSLIKWENLEKASWQTSVDFELK